MCDYLGITLQTTAAESPWSNKIAERCNHTFVNMINKITAGTQCSLDFAPCWAVNAKYLAKFSPLQLVLGSNLYLPSSYANYQH